jgi:hypothetical protein
VETADFAGPHIAAEVGIRGSDRIDVVFGLGYSASSTLSEFREFVGDDGLPITQTTEFNTLPLTAGVKAYLLPRGRSIGSFAWVPRNLNAFAGIAGGMVWYRFEQYGEFVDEGTLDIFVDNFKSVEKAPTLHLFTGLDVSLNRSLMLTGEARYGFAKAPFQQFYYGTADFVNFPELDLTGLTLSCGVSFRL